MKLVLKKRTSPKVNGRMKKKVRIRKTLKGTEERPRLCVFKSAKHIYAQIISDVTGNTLVSSSSVEVDAKVTGKELAKFIGADVAKKAIQKNIKAVVFDRNGYLYHGRIQSLADGAREAGLNF